MPKQLACEFWIWLYYLFNMIRMADETEQFEWLYKQKNS